MDDYITKQSIWIYKSAGTMVTSMVAPIATQTPRPAKRLQQNPSLRQETLLPIDKKALSTLSERNQIPSEFIEFYRNQMSKS